MGRSEKSAKGYIAKENIAKGYIYKLTTRPQGRSLRAPKWDEAKNRPKGTSAKRCSARGYMIKGTQVGRSEKSVKKSAKGYINKEIIDQKEFFGQRVYD